MAKPIFTIGFPWIIDQSDDYMDINRQTEDNIHAFNEMVRVTEPWNKDYHVLLYTSNTEEPVFQAFYDKDFTDGKFEEFKAMVEKQHEELKAKIQQNDGGRSN